MYLVHRVKKNGIWELYTQVIRKYVYTVKRYR